MSCQFLVCLNFSLVQMRWPFFHFASTWNEPDDLLQMELNSHPNKFKRCCWKAQLLARFCPIRKILKSFYCSENIAASAPSPSLWSPDTGTLLWLHIKEHRRLVFANKAKINPSKNTQSHSTHGTPNSVKRIPNGKFIIPNSFFEYKKKLI